MKKTFIFFHFLRKKTSNIISKLNDNFSEVLHTSVGPKIKILENRSSFLNFTVDTPGRF